MKLIRLSLMVILLTATGVIYAQDNKSDILILHCDKITISLNGKVSTLEGNACIESERLKIVAEKIIINNQSRKVTAYGYQEFSFSGKVVVDQPGVG